MSTACLRGLAARPCECPARCAGPGEPRSGVLPSRGACRGRDAAVSEAHAQASAWVAAISQSGGTEVAGPANAIEAGPRPRRSARRRRSSVRPACRRCPAPRAAGRSEEHTSELQSLMRISYAVFCLKKKKQTKKLEHI